MTVDGWYIFGDQIWAKKWYLCTHPIFPAAEQVEKVEHDMNRTFYGWADVGGFFFFGLLLS